MKDCNKDIIGYLNDRVKLSPAKNTELTARRDANRERLKTGLNRDDKPSPVAFVTQGSRAMGTTTQEPGNTYDIDDGAVFNKADLVGDDSSDMTALSARNMARDAVDDGSFKREPEIKTNCVRVFYDDGPNVDIPVYRELADGSYELAGADWRRSDPSGVNDWFKKSVDGKAGDGAASQFRALIQLQKHFCINRPSYSLPSGFVLTVLTNEAFAIAAERLDMAFRRCVEAIHGRLTGSLVVHHPVVDENLADADDPKLSNYRALLATAVQDFKVLDKGNCLRSEALKVWKKVFNSEHFDSAIREAEEEEKKQAEAAVARLVHVPKPWCA